MRARYGKSIRVEIGQQQISTRLKMAFKLPAGLGHVCNVVQFVHSETPRGARVIPCEATLAHPENLLVGLFLDASP